MSVPQGESKPKYRPEDGKLHDGEVFWRDHQPWLKEKGYILRSRYQPDWVASWLRSSGSQKPYRECEDGFKVRVSLKMKNLLISPANYATAK